MDRGNSEVFSSGDTLPDSCSLESSILCGSSSENNGGQSGPNDAVFIPDASDADPTASRMPDDMARVFAENGSDRSVLQHLREEAHPVTAPHDTQAPPDRAAVTAELTRARYGAEAGRSHSPPTESMPREAWSPFTSDLHRASAHLAFPPAHVDSHGPSWANRGLANPPAPTQPMSFQSQRLAPAFLEHERCALAPQLATRFL